MLKARIITAVIALAVLMVVLFAVPARFAEAAMAAATLGGAWEWSSLVKLKSVSGRVTFVGLVGVLLAAVYSFLGTYGVEILLAGVVWWIAAMIWVMAYPTPVAKPLVWFGGVLVLIPFFVALVTLYRAGAETLLFALTIVWAADIGAFFAGKQFGKVKLAPSISPGKTWEGVIGGLVAVVLLSMAGSYWFDVSLLQLLPFCLAVACISVVGDLTVSIFKRNAGIKDSGTLFPGHGGLLDRVDSIAAATPVFALGVAWMGLL
ncbi:MAG: phosphatidate cytidylyltransferase [Woeseiaceae bacterium]|nr:phosphatidate cytidylyltransferase [Woeseiaceae bacterium]